MVLENENKMSWVVTIAPDSPTLYDNTGYVDRVISELKSELKTNTIHVGLSIARKIPQLLKGQNNQLTCVLVKIGLDSWSLVYTTSSQKTEIIAGLAIDLGTSCISIQIVNLISGETLGKKNFDNPQIKMGSDILTRIHYAIRKEGLNHLHALVIDSINKHILELSLECNIDSNNIHILSVAGNTTMTHLFLNITPEHIFKEPYTPSINEPGIIKAGEIGISVHPNAHMFVFPNIGSYLGGDLIAGIFYSGISNKKSTSILVDIGTNAEVVLGNKDWMVACAGAAGPALEGGAAEIGELAKNGTIDRIKINLNSKRVRVNTIGNTLARGICGSGMIDLVSELFISRLVDEKGKFHPNSFPEFFIKKGNSLQFVVVPSKESESGKDLTISQTDINSLISSKAAMYTILETITSSVGINFSDLDSFFIAGTFGLYMNPKSAITIGMIPDISDSSLYKSIGNSSLGGAVKVLQNINSIEEINKIKSKVTYMELNVNQDFMNRFSAAKFLPHTNVSIFPSVI